MARMSTRTQNRAVPAPPRAASLALLALMTACGGGEEGDASPDGPRRNVLLVTLDTTRADRLGCYGGSAATPNLDRLADEGALFARAVSTAGLTPMSHASILTGLNNYRHGLRVFFSETVSSRLEDDNVTLAEVLRDRGWRTGAFVSAYPASDHYGLDQGFETFSSGAVEPEVLDLQHQQRHEELWNEEGRSKTQRRSDHTVNEALGWLDGDGDEERPWCLWVHLFDVHDFSLVPPSDWMQERFGIEYDAEVQVNDAQWRERMYDPELTYADEQLGRLFERIRERGEWDRTVVVVTADHGQGLLDGLKNHGWLKHRLLYYWSLNVPLIVRVPGEPAGARIEPLVRTIDVLPTVLEALHVPAPEVEGASVLDLWRGGPDDHRLAYADALNLHDAHAPTRMKAEYLDNLYSVTDARWKLIFHERTPANNELFDLSQDPQELRNVAAEHPEEVARLKAFLDDNGATVMRAPGAVNVTDVEKLRELGYIEGPEDYEQPPAEAEDDEQAAPGSRDPPADPQE